MIENDVVALCLTLQFEVSDELLFAHLVADVAPPNLCLNNIFLPRARNEEIHSTASCFDFKRQDPTNTPREQVKIGEQEVPSHGFLWCIRHL